MKYSEINKTKIKVMELVLSGIKYWKIAKITGYESYYIQKLCLVYNNDPVKYKLWVKKSKLELKNEALQNLPNTSQF
jgi:hypothetical protein